MVRSALCAIENRKHRRTEVPAGPFIEPLLWRQPGPFRPDKLQAEYNERGLTKHVPVSSIIPHPNGNRKTATVRLTIDPEAERAALPVKDVVEEARPLVKVSLKVKGRAEALGLTRGGMLRGED